MCREKSEGGEGRDLRDRGLRDHTRYRGKFQKELNKELEAKGKSISVSATTFGPVFV